MGDAGPRYARVRAERQPPSHFVDQSAERYERRSVIITTNLVFSEWDRIFKDPMTTMAAIDRVVHHSVILDLMAVESYRAQEAHDQRATTEALPGPATAGTEHVG